MLVFDLRTNFIKLLPIALNTSNSRYKFVCLPVNLGFSDNRDGFAFPPVALRRNLIVSFSKVFWDVPLLATIIPLFLCQPLFRAPTLFSWLSFLQRLQQSSSTLCWCINMSRDRTFSCTNIAWQYFQEGESFAIIALIWKFSFIQIPDAMREPAILWTCSRIAMPSTILNCKYLLTSELFNSFQIPHHKLIKALLTVLWHCNSSLSILQKACRIESSICCKSKGSHYQPISVSFQECSGKAHWAHMQYSIALGKLWSDASSNNNFFHQDE